MTIYLVIEDDADKFCGYEVIAGFANRINAINFLDKDTRDRRIIEIKLAD